jgi:hypothetical protein
VKPIARNLDAHETWFALLQMLRLDGCDFEDGLGKGGSEEESSYNKKPMHSGLSIDPESNAVKRKLNGRTLPHASR